MTSPLPSGDEPVTTSQLMAVRLVRGVAGSADLRGVWLELEGASGEPDFFQSFARSMHVAETRYGIDSRRFEIRPDRSCGSARTDGGSRASGPRSS
jgi:hypothetical protein